MEPAGAHSNIYALVFPPLAKLSEIIYYHNDYQSHPFLQLFYDLINRSAGRTLMPTLSFSFALPCTLARLLAHRSLLLDFPSFFLLSPLLYHKERCRSLAGRAHARAIWLSSYISSFEAAVLYVHTRGRSLRTIT